MGDSESGLQVLAQDLWSVKQCTRESHILIEHKDPDAGIINFYQLKVRYMRLEFRVFNRCYRTH